MSEARGQKYRAAARAGRSERGSRGAREADLDPGDALAPAVESPRWPFSEESQGSDPEPRDEDDGRHGTVRARPDGPVRQGSGEAGRRRRASTEDRAPGERAPAVPTGPGRAARRRGEDAPSSSGSNGNGTQRTGSNGTGSNGTGSNGTGSNGTGSNGNGSNSNGSSGNGIAGGAGAGTGRRAKRDADSATPVAERTPERTTEKPAAPEGRQEEPVREPERVESTEGLGIADLLAGALAAYRGI